jgi:hypothetical protein
MDIGNLMMIMIRADIVKSAPSPSSGAVSPASALSTPALLTLSSIAVILDVFVNKQVTLAGLLVLWKEKWLSRMINCIRLLCSSLTPYVRTVEILQGLGERECTKEVKDMAIARLDMVVQVILIARIATLDRIMLIVAPVMCPVLEEPIQAIASIIAQSLWLLPSMDLEMVIGLSVKKQQQERLLHRSIWFALIQSR